MGFWSYRLVSAATNSSLGEIPDCRDRKVAFPLSRTDTASFRIHVDNRFADTVMGCRSNLWIVDPTGQTMFNGPIVTAEEEADEDQTIFATAASPFWWLDHRLLGMSHEGVTLTDTGVNKILNAIVDTANALGNTTIHQPTALTAGASMTVGPWRYKPASEAFQEVVASADGPDWWLKYVPPGSTFASGMKTCEIYFAVKRGGDRSASVFLEYGTGQLSLRGYKRSVSRAGLLTRAYGLPPAFPDTAEAVTVVNDTSLESQYGASYGVVPNDLGNPALRTALQAAHVQIRRQPREVVSLTAYREDKPRLKPPGGTGDYEVGDLVTARASIRRKIRLNATLRVYQVSFDIDDLGQAVPTIDVVPDY